jgi:hypothetical protein
MTERKLIIVAIATAGIVASCAPYPEQPTQPTQGTANAEEQNTLSSEEQQKLQEERKKAAEEAKRKMEEENGSSTEGDGGNGGTSGATDDGGPSSWPFARAVPGKEGFVFSPYNNKVIDVRDIPSGTLVQDPTYAASEKKYFRVP